MLLRGDNLEVKLRTPVKDRAKRVVFAGAAGVASGSASASSAPVLQQPEERKEDSLSSRFTRFTEDAGKNLLSYFEASSESDASVPGPVASVAAAPAPAPGAAAAPPVVPSRQGNSSYHFSPDKVAAAEDPEEAAAAERKRDKLMRMASNLVKK
jgi:hypothetical protein